MPPVFLFLYGFFIYAIVYFGFRGDFITITIFIIKRSFPMLYPAVELVCFAIESLIDLIIYSSLLNIKFKSLRHPIAGLTFYFISSNILAYIFPNAFGWICVCLLSYLTALYTTKSSPFEVLMTYIISYMLTAFSEDFLVMVFNKIQISNINLIALTSSAIIIIVSALVCHFAPVHKFFCFLMNGNAITKFLLLHLFTIYMIETGIYKYSSSDISSYIPYIASIAVIIIITDVVLLNQQRTISKQKHDLASYETYQPMMTDLIQDILGRQHDFNNHLAAINMLPYSCKDYDSLANAITKYSSNIASDYKCIELLKINMPIVAGFIHSKMISSDKLGINLDVTIKNRFLVSNTPEYDIIRIVGILIDNSLDASQKSDTVFLTLDSIDSQIIIETLNRGRQLTQELRQRMFETGYTTKKADRTFHGYGLANLKKLVNQYNGQICLDNQQIDGVTYIHFEVRL